MENTAYTLRELNAKDLFDVIRIVNKIGVREIKQCLSASELQKILMALESDGNESAIATVGFSVIVDVAGMVMEHLPDCESDLYRLLSAMSGIEETEIPDLTACVLFDMVMDVIKQPFFNDFFRRYVGLSK